MPSLVVSLHDVSPLTFEACDWILRELRTVGITKTSLLVIPDHHQRAPLRNHSDFCHWLRARVSDGHEPVLHGYTHLRIRKPAESLQDRFTTRIYTRDEGEFFDISAEQATERVQQGLLEFQRIGLHPTGFIAPAWLLSMAAERVLRDVGLRYTTVIQEIRDLVSGLSHPSRSLCWSVRSGWRRIVSLGYNAAQMKVQAQNEVLRIAIHPVDAEYERIWNQIVRLISLGLNTRQATTYAGWLATRPTT